MDTANIIYPSLCEVGIESENKEAVLALCAKKASSKSGISMQIILDALRAREKEGSTGFGNEIAIPHARIEGMKNFILFILTSTRGVSYKARDGKRVRLFFVLLGPADKVQEHLKMLALISRAIGDPDTKEEILQAVTPQGQADAFMRHIDTEAIAPIPPTQSTDMSLFFVILYDEDMVEDILEIFLEYGIEGATILDSSGMGKFISNTPLFGNFIGCMHQNKHHSKTIMVMVPKPHIPPLIKAIEKEIGDINTTQAATLFAIDISVYKGSMNIV